MTDSTKKKKDIIIDKPEQPSTFVPQEPPLEETVQAPTSETSITENEVGTFIPPVDNEPTAIVQQSTSSNPKKMIKLETPIGTEIEMTEEQAEKLLSGEGREESKFAKDLNEILVNVSQERLDRITDGLKKGILKLEYVKGGKVVPMNVEYVPITYGKNKKVNKIMKQARLLREDINECLAGKIQIQDLITKYKEILSEDTEVEELRNAAFVNETVGNFVIAQKAKIYWDIDNIEDYVLSDVVLIIGLYERRNSYTNT